MARGRRIGRKKLAPLDAATKKYLLDWSTQPLLLRPETFPRLVSSELFGNGQPLEVEIGPGTGEALSYMASQAPDRNFLGIEASHRSAHLAASQAAKGKLENLRIVRADFKLLAPLLVANSWERVYLHFPDPAHKRGDEKRMIFTQGFLDAMAKILVPQGEISVASDKPDFFMKMLELAEGDGRFVKAHEGRYLEGFERPVKSRFQRFWESKGVIPLLFVVRKLA